MNTQAQKFSTQEMYWFCNKHRFFTCGDNEQYKKFFQDCENGLTANEMAHLLWYCSDQEHEQILREVRKLFDEYSND